MRVGDARVEWPVSLRSPLGRKVRAAARGGGRSGGRDPRALVFRLEEKRQEYVNG